MEAKKQNIHQELIERCRENDRSAQFELYKIYYKPMYNTSLRILNNPAEAEDVMQESFLTAFSKLRDYSGEGSFGGWLRRIVVNNSIDELKKRSSTLSIDENISESDFENESDFNEQADYKIAEIKNAMQLLPEDHRVIISLFLFEGYDHEEIAQILSISNSASRTRYSRARQKLLNVLSEQRTIKMFHPN
ncbi:MAG: RNA polymerase sigma factor [Bacteroidetes bacterium]|nr:RNA polymerase sigma factor [Bacteroidota bacterium]